MQEQITADICVIGAGSGGLSVAAGASQMGANTVLVERHLMGGDCLNTGCIPSKALLAAAHAAHAVRTAHRFGITTSPPTIDMEQVHAHVHEVIAAIAPHDSVARFAGLGVRVIQATGRFLNPHELEAGTTRIRARRFVIATGSRPRIPTIPGLDNTPFFTNESIFANRQSLPHLLVLGGGPIGLEMAQAHHRLGSQVTVVERETFLSRDDPELTAVLQKSLHQEGITFYPGAQVRRIKQTNAKINLTMQTGSCSEQQIYGTHLLVATGRCPNLEALNLDAAGVRHTPDGIGVDAGLRTSNRRIYALGDVTGPHLFTHVAGYQAGIVLRNALFRLPAKVDYRTLPRVTYTDPELAQVGLTEAMARQQGHPVRILTRQFSENDRARTEKSGVGLIKVVTGRRGCILGVGIVGPQAGELLAPWILAMQKNLRLGDLASSILPYPTLAEISKGVAGTFFTPTLYSERTRKIVKFLLKFTSL
ncbi:MAG: FAD-dependent oxidoreductase [Magnetococcus sp. DMHC-1]|nr:FAD-dependent oxidoreductase [Magnetococcales bacterium]